MSAREELSADTIRRDIAMDRPVSRADVLDTLRSAIDAANQQASIADDGIAKLVAFLLANALMRTFLEMKDRWTVAPNGEASLGTEPTE